MPLLGAFLFLSLPLCEADLRGADLREAGLGQAILVRTSLTNCGLTGAYIYGIFVWDMETNEKTKQTDLVITPPREPPVRVDDLEVA